MKKRTGSLTINHQSKTSIEVVLALSIISQKPISIWGACHFAIAECLNDPSLWQCYFLPKTHTHTLSILHTTPQTTRRFPFSLSLSLPHATQTTKPTPSLPSTTHWIWPPLPLSQFPSFTHLPSLFLIISGWSDLLLWWFLFWKSLDFFSSNLGLNVFVRNARNGEFHLFPSSFCFPSWWDARRKGEHHLFLFLFLLVKRPLKMKIRKEKLRVLSPKL